MLFSGVYNRVVYWHRFIYSQERTLAGKLWAKVCFRYYRLMNRMLDLVKRTSRRDRDIKARAFREATQYLHSGEYAALPPVK